MAVRKRKMMLDAYPRPHSDEIQFLVINQTASIVTNYPIIMYDEGLGAPSSYNANPEHASFADYEGPNCYPGSRVDSVFAVFEAELTNYARETDKIKNIRIGFLPIFTAFKEKLLAQDEKSQNEIQDVLGMQFETTDRQAYPLYSGTDMTTGDAPFGLGADVPGTTGGTTIEKVTTFDLETYFDNLQYYTTSDQLRALAPKVHWRSVKDDMSVTFKFRYKLNSRVKFMNPFTYCGCIIIVEDVDNVRQFNQSGDMTGTAQLHIKCRYRFLEWNPNFNMAQA